MTARLAIGSRDASRILRDCFEDDGEQDNAMVRAAWSTRTRAVSGTSVTAVIL